MRAIVLATLALGAVPVAVINASTAHADATAFLNDLKSQGAALSASTPSDLLTRGYQICQDISTNGATGVGDELQLMKGDLDNKTVAIFISSAVKDLCPNQMPTLAAWERQHGG